MPLDVLVTVAVGRLQLVRVVLGAIVVVIVDPIDVEEEDGAERVDVADVLLFVLVTVDIVVDLVLVLTAEDRLLLRDDDVVDEERLLLEDVGAVPQ